MNRNPLFNFITHYVLTAHKTYLRPGVKLVAATNKKGTGYYRFELPQLKYTFQVKDHAYQRIAHHLSVYKEQSSVSPNLSSINCLTALPTSSSFSKYTIWCSSYPLDNAVASRSRRT